MATPSKEQVALWDAINKYVVTCRGNPSLYVYGNTARMTAVSEVEAAIAAIQRADLSKVLKANRERDDWRHRAELCSAAMDKFQEQRDEARAERDAAKAALELLSNATQQHAVRVGKVGKA